MVTQQQGQDLTGPIIVAGAGLLGVFLVLHYQQKTPPVAGTVATSCPTGSVYNATVGQCVSSLTGQAVAPTCPVGYIVSGTSCVATASNTSNCPPYSASGCPAGTTPSPATVGGCTIIRCTSNSPTSQYTSPGSPTGTTSPTVPTCTAPNTAYEVASGQYACTNCAAGGVPQVFGVNSYACNHVSGAAPTQTPTGGGGCPGSFNAISNPSSGCGTGGLTCCYNAAANVCCIASGTLCQSLPCSQILGSTGGNQPQGSTPSTASCPSGYTPVAAGYDGDAAVTAPYGPFCYSGSQCCLPGGGSCQFVDCGQAFYGVATQQPTGGGGGGSNYCPVGWQTVTSGYDGDTSVTAPYGPFCYNGSQCCLPTVNDSACTTVDCTSYFYGSASSGGGGSTGSNGGICQGTGFPIYDVNCQVDYCQPSGGCVPDQYGNPTCVEIDGQSCSAAACNGGTCA